METTTTIEMKKCTVCGEVKPLDQFTRDRHAKGGYAARCKKCHNAYCKDSYQKRKAKNGNGFVSSKEVKDPIKLDDRTIKELQEYNLDAIPPRLLVAQLRKLGFRGQLELVTIQKVVI